MVDETRASRIATIRAPNPSPLTLEGTNSYLVETGDGRMIAIDPGPAIVRHVEALAAHAAARSCEIAAIFVTHGHPDHAPGARLLKDLTGAAVFAHRSARFPHDVALEPDYERSETLVIGSLQMDVLHVPGHASDHLAFYYTRERALFTGDVVLGRGTVVVAPPSGDMRAYQRSLHALRRLFDDAATIRGGHGPVVDDPLGKLDEYIAHREHRERQILTVLAHGPATIPEIVATIYVDTPRVLWPAAARQALAHLIALTAEGTVREEVLDRPLEPGEAAIMIPDLSSIADPEVAAVAEAEFGTAEGTSISRYRLA